MALWSRLSEDTSTFVWLTFQLRKLRSYPWQLCTHLHPRAGQHDDGDEDDVDKDGGDG